MGNGDVAGLVRMLELPVIAFAANAFPTLGLKSLDDLGAPHVVYVYTMHCSASSEMGEECYPCL
jgi:hypothetical protein